MLHFHPAAKGKPPGEASRAPASPVPGIEPGVRTPDVCVVPVACISNVPSLVKDFIRGRIKKEAPETVVLLDFGGSMREQFGMKEGQANLLLIDVSGRVRMKITGELDQATYAHVLQSVDYLRAEGAK